MAFILAADGRYDDVVEAFSRYRAFLQASRELFPPSAFALATSDWYFDPRNHRCPHDAWLEGLVLTEATVNGEMVRGAALTVRLLGAYHDGHIELRYPKVFAYQLNADVAERGHGDWRYDELRVNAHGHLIHEIEWSGRDQTGRWLIEASDLELRWLPKPGHT